MTPSNVRRTPSRRLLLVVAESLIVGLVLPILLAVRQASGGGESPMTGAALLGLGIDWALIAIMPIRFTDERPQ